VCDIVAAVPFTYLLLCLHAVNLVEGFYAPTCLGSHLYSADAVLRCLLLDRRAKPALVRYSYLRADGLGLVGLVGCLCRFFVGCTRRARYGLAGRWRRCGRNVAFYWYRLAYAGGSCCSGDSANAAPRQH